MLRIENKRKAALILGVIILIAGAAYLHYSGIKIQIVTDKPAQEEQTCRLQEFTAEPLKFIENRLTYIWNASGLKTLWHKADQTLDEAAQKLGY